MVDERVLRFVKKVSEDHARAGIGQPSTQEGVSFPAVLSGTVSGCEAVSSARDRPTAVVLTTLPTPRADRTIASWHTRPRATRVRVEAGSVEHRRRTIPESARAGPDRNPDRAGRAVAMAPPAEKAKGWPRADKAPVLPRYRSSVPIRVPSWPRGIEKERAHPEFHNRCHR